MHIASPNLHTVDYAAFANSLAGEGARYSFEEISRIGGGPLPMSAYNHPPWWSNDKTHSHMRKVLEAGYMSKDLDLENHKVSFYRNRVGAQKALVKKQDGHTTEDGQNRRTEGMSKSDFDEGKNSAINRNSSFAHQKPGFGTGQNGIHFEQIVEEFTRRIADGGIEIDKEASVQRGLTTLLKEKLPDYKIQREYNIYNFFPNEMQFVKTRVDIALFNAPETERFAVEIKFPTNGAYPMYMFQCFQDVRFLEQLKDAGFTGGFFLLIASDSNFWRNGGKSGTIYEKFRKKKKMYGEAKDVGDNPEEVCLEGEYLLEWMTIKDSLRYCLIRV